ncbi:nuclear cap-binding protein subunit 2 [Vairimorpha necatrix]|uniref:Nuclear cap-binding protein subunit 2 n=1 Tax=Vairimorpha necatrix TaxID=6039 RepID=A0AAX4JFF9_9MICR
MWPLEKYYKPATPVSYYKEKTFTGSDDEYLKLMNESSTVYINNIDPSIDESRIWELALLFGDVKRVIMGINRNYLTFCGFCFVEFYNKEDALKCKMWADRLKFEKKCLSVDKDYGFKEGRQYGRGVFGGKMKDDNAKKRRYYNN